MGFNDWRINGAIILEPTTGRWLAREPLDQQGDNRPIYSAVRRFELRWQLVSYGDWAALQWLYNLVESTGTHTVRLPTFPTATGTSYGFTEYSGTTLIEPATGPFFETYPSEVLLIIDNIII